MVKTPEDLIVNVSTFYQGRKKKKDIKIIDSVASKEYKLIYDSSSQTLEPVYFWILDFMNGMFGGKVEKIVDNFISSPGSAHFSELMQKGTIMRDEGMKIMQTVGILIKSLINIIYDLRQFEIRLNDYDAANSKDKITAEAGLRSLKQTWLDKVDMARGNTSVKGMAFSNAAFATLIDAFMIVKDEKLKDSSGKNLDLNERVKRILEQRILEFNKWRGLSERELRKRYSIEKTWLKNQVDSLKLYSKWAKPYLKAAEELTMDGDSDAALVTAFNTMNMQLTIFGKKEIKVKEAAIEHDLPEDFKNLSEKKIRKYYQCVLVDFKFRGIPQKAGQHYLFGGRAEVTFKSFALNQDELDLFKEKQEKSDVADALNMVETATTGTLKDIQEDIEYFLKDEEEKKLEETQKKDSQDVNPFTALFNFKGFKKEKLEDKDAEKKANKERMEKLKKGIKKDNYAESVVRKLAEKESMDSCYTIYDIYKKAHQMASTPDKV